MGVNDVAQLRKQDHRTDRRQEPHPPKSHWSKCRSWPRRGPLHALAGIAGQLQMRVIVEHVERVDVPAVVRLPGLSVHDGALADCASSPPLHLAREEVHGAWTPRDAACYS